MNEYGKPKFYKLGNYITEYTERNTENEFRPVAVGRYGIRTRESIYSKELAKDYSKNKLIFKDTLTVGMGSVQIDIGVLTDDVTYSVSPAYHTYKISGIDSAYLRYCLECRNQDMFQRYVKRGSRQGKTIDLKRWLDYEIPVYEHNVQLDIVDRIERVKEIISLRQQELQKLDELVKARFVEMFGDPIDNTKKLPVEQFSRCCLDMHQGINTVADKVEYQSVGYPIIQSKNITKGYLDLLDVRYLTDKDYLKYHEKYNPKVNDMLICNIGTIGKSLIIKEEQDFLIAWNLFLVKLNLEKVKPDYIKVFVEFLNDRHYYDQFLTGGTVKFVNKKTMGNIPVILPPMELQNQFADFVKQLDKSKVAVQKALDEAQLLFDSLMQKYFG